MVTGKGMRRTAKLWTYWPRGKLFPHPVLAKTRAEMVRAVKGAKLPAGDVVRVVVTVVARKRSK